jgi:MerR family copper efflux transcriptional regulator
METYTVSEVAARTGFSPSALRYYDERGLVPAPARSGAGYRLYDDRSIDRLAVVSRAKRLGLGLDDITDLLRLWDDDECEPVQSRLAEMVTAKLDETRRTVAELSAFASELTALRARLGRAPHAGPCDEHCACLVEQPVACTLGVDAVPERVAAWAELIEHADERIDIDGGVRLTFPGSSELLAQVAALAAAEQRCCAFLTFTLTFVDDRGHLDVTAPPAGTEMLADLFRVTT